MSVPLQGQTVAQLLNDSMNHNNSDWSAFQYEKATWEMLEVAPQQRLNCQIISKGVIFYIDH